jgi:hypothetical protein
MVSKRVPTAKASRTAAKRAAKAIKQPSGKDPPASDEERWRLTAIAAYYRAEARGFAPGGELEDWLAAERDIELDPRAVASAPASAAASAEESEKGVKPAGKSARKRTKLTRGAALDARKQEDRS